LVGSWRTSPRSINLIRILDSHNKLDGGRTSAELIPFSG
jgi:hypothetical protein